MWPDAPVQTECVGLYTSPAVVAVWFRPCVGWHAATGTKQHIQCCFPVCACVCVCDRARRACRQGRRHKST